MRSNNSLPTYAQALDSIHGVHSVGAGGSITGSGAQERNFFLFAYDISADSVKEQLVSALRQDGWLIESGARNDSQPSEWLRAHDKANRTCATYIQLTSPEQLSAIYGARLDASTIQILEQNITDRSSLLAAVGEPCNS